MTRAVKSQRLDCHRTVVRRLRPKNNFIRGGMQLIQEAAKSEAAGQRFVRKAALMPASISDDDNPVPAGLR